jgi:hypothetical protein
LKQFFSLNFLGFSTTSCCPCPPSSPDITHVTSFHSNFTQLQTVLFSSQIRYNFLFPLDLSPLTDNGHSSIGSPTVRFRLRWAYNQPAPPIHGFLACCLLLLVSYLANSLSLQMEAIWSFETLGSLQTTRDYNPEDCTLHSHCHENRKSNSI